MYDILGYLLLHFDEQEREARRIQNEMVMNHMSRIHARKPESKQEAKANKKFVDKLMQEVNRGQANDKQKIKHAQRDQRKLSWGFEEDYKEKGEV